ncbi:hypothetical protein COOONC_15698, partial [Cooperia oncophora]
MVTAQGCFGHVGHRVETALPHLSQEQENYLKDLLEVHSVDYIMNRLKEDFPLETSRLHRVTREELRTIQRKYRLTPVPAENDCGDLWMEDEKKHNPSGQDKCEDVKDFQDLMSAMECEPGIAVENDPSTSQGDDKRMKSSRNFRAASACHRTPSTQEVSDAPPKSDVSECESPLSPERRFDMSSSSSTAHSLETPFNKSKRKAGEREALALLFMFENDASEELVRSFAEISLFLKRGYQQSKDIATTYHRDIGADGEPQDYTVFKKTLKSLSEFEKWMSEQCERTCTSFFRKTTRQQSERKGSFHLRCGRSGRYVSGGLKRPRPSTKQTRHCTCFLNVRVNEYGTVTVIGCFGHIGHKIDAALIRLSHPQEMFLKDQLEKYPVGYVLM